MVRVIFYGLFIFTGLLCSPGSAKRDACLYFFPNNKKELTAFGYKKDPAIDGLVTQNFNDTFVYFMYPNEETRFYKIIRYSFVNTKLDSNRLFTYFSSLDPSFTKQKKTLTVMTSKGDSFTYKISYGPTRKAIDLIYYHPKYVEYMNKNNINSEAPSVAEPSRQQ